MNSGKTKLFTAFVCPSHKNSTSNIFIIQTECNCKDKFCLHLLIDKYAYWCNRKEGMKNLNRLTGKRPHGTVSFLLDSLLFSKCIWHDKHLLKTPNANNRSTPRDVVHTAALFLNPNWTLPHSQWRHVCWKAIHLHQSQTRTNSTRGNILFTMYLYTDKTSAGRSLLMVKTSSVGGSRSFG